MEGACRSMNILMLPLFRFPTGHTKAAEAIIEVIKKNPTHTHVDTVDLLSYTSKTLEKGIGSFYIKWIQTSPKSYQFVYEKLVNKKDKSKKKKDGLPFVSAIFQHNMQKIIEEKQPDIIICTHAFASSIVALLKQQKRIKDIPVVNAYTDFFLNDVWAKSTSEYHFVPHEQAKQTLITKYQRDPNKIFITGVPIHRGITKTPAQPKSHNVLLAGGNIGFLKTDDLAHLADKMPDTTFTVLCGNNKKLFKAIENMHKPTLIPRGYITTREAMNELYEETSIIVTKPGGVTMTEVMRKRIPIFIDHFLPGPEEENYHYLAEHGMVRMLNDNALEELANPVIAKNMAAQIEKYEQQLDHTLDEAIATIFAQLQNKQ